MASCSAVHTSSACMLGAIAQPTTLRAYRSSTTAKYNQPLRVRMRVMSLTQAWLGPLGLKRRASTLSETGSAWPLSVVWTNLRCHSACSRCSRIKRRTRYRPMCSPFECSNAPQRRLP